MDIILFPNLAMKNTPEIDLGFSKVWNFDLKSSEYIVDGRLREKVKSILTMNVTSWDRSIKNIGILTIGEPDFHDVTDEEIALANETKLLLFLSLLANNVSLEISDMTAWNIYTSENLSLYTQKFHLDIDHLAESIGFIVQKQSGGYKIGESKFAAARFVHHPLFFQYDARLLDHLLIVRKQNNKLYQLILRATDLFFESYYNDPNVSYNARILQQCAAFEVLLAGPGRRGREGMKSWIKQETNSSNDKIVNYQSERPNKLAPETEPIRVFWADQFFTLRNHIIHGNAVNSTDYQFAGCQQHFSIAPLFFTLLIKKLINHDLNSDVFIDSINWQDNYGFVYSDNEVSRKTTEIFPKPE